ncbi:beta strand repeat-containing protein [Chitinophagaceae bacterium MMS25-I14]
MISPKLFLITVVFSPFALHAQQRISDGTASAQISDAAVLELQSSNKGFLPTRVALTDRLTWSPMAGTAVKGMIVYNTAIGGVNGLDTGLVVWEGAWNPLSNASQADYWRLKGNTGTTPPATIGTATGTTNYWGTADKQNLAVATNGISRALFDTSGSLYGGNSITSSATNSLIWGDSISVTGKNNLATGSSIIVAASNTAAIGQYDTVSGPGSFVQGTRNNVSGRYAVALGGDDPAVSGWDGGNTVTGENAFAMGSGNKATGRHSHTMGDVNTAAGYASFAGGEGSNVSNQYAFSWGGGNSVGGNSATAFGYGNSADGAGSFVAGGFNHTTAGNSTVFGGANVFTGGSPNTWIATDPIFQIGNGTQYNQRSNAMTVLHNGYTSIGAHTTLPAATMEVFGTAKIDTLLSGSVSDSVVTDSIGFLHHRSLSSLNSNDWHINGNTGTNSGANFLGTTDNHSLKFKVNNQQAGFIDSSTSFGIANGNVFYGLQAGNSNPRATTYNTFIGSAAGYSTTPTSAASPADGFKNVAIGTQAMYLNTTGQQNTAAGYQALSNNTTGLANTAIGTQAMNTGTSSNNTAVGWHALNQNTGNTNVAVGYDALGSNQQGAGAPNGNVTYTQTGTQNVALGPKALRGNISGSNNIALGYQSMLENTVSGGGTGSDNISIGTNALSTTSTGSSNVAIGSSAGSSNTSGNNNVIVGYSAGASSSGSNNTMIGYQSGNTNSTGINNTLIGYKADVSAATLTNASAIGYNAKVAQNNSLALGGTGADAVNVGIGTATPNSTLVVNGSVAAAIVSVTASYTLLTTDYTIVCRGAGPITLTLPDPATCKGRIYHLVNNSSADVAMSRSVETAAGENKSTISSGYFSAGYGNSGNKWTIQSDGTTWVALQNL